MFGAAALLTRTSRPADATVVHRRYQLAGNRQAMLQLTVALILVAVSWWASWREATWLAHHAFFPLWFGYIFAVDSLTRLRAGSSLWTREKRAFGALFVVSIPLWWLFEAFNTRLENWTYTLPHDYSWLAYHLEATLAFSTVVPAIFVTAELYRSLGFPGRLEHWIVLSPGRTGWAMVSLAGLAIITATLIWPQVLFPFAWIGLFFFVDPLVRLASGWSVAAQVERGWWAGVFRLFAAGITCGFFWEMWNVRAMPKWTYDIAYAEWAHLFEMPLLGYGGYFPFALETYAFVMAFNRIFAFLPVGFLQFDRPRDSAHAIERF